MIQYGEDDPDTDTWVDEDGTVHRGPSTVGNPDRFIDRKDGLLVADLVDAVDAMGKIATDHGGRLYHYDKGAWFGDGERVVTERVARLLGNRFRCSHASNVLAVIRCREPLFTDDGLDTRYINTPNGLLEWRTGALHSHDAAVPNLSRIPVDWDAHATCPTIDRWLSEVFPHDALDFIYEVIGYCLLNDNPLHKAILLFGRGRNGKGTFLRLLRALIGEANISTVTPQSLDENRFRAAEMHGRLANLVGDVDPRIFKATETFKQITGGDVITAERKYGHPFAFRCRAVMVAAFNALPRTADTSEGFFSRWVVVPFSGYFPADKADPNLFERLLQPGELEGLLVRAVAGLRRVLARGHFDLPESVREATWQFRHAADPVRAFLAEATVGDADFWVPRTALFTGWEQWSAANGFHGTSAATFYERVEAAAEEVFGHPLRAATRKGTRGFRGCRFRSDNTDTRGVA